MNRVLQISAEDAKYIDPNQIACLEMVDGTVIYVKGNEEIEGFTEEQLNEQNQENNLAQQQGQGPALRGKTLSNIAKGALGVAAVAGAVGAAASIANSVTSPKPMIGMAPLPRPGIVPMARPIMPPMGGVVPMPRPGVVPMGRPMPIPPRPIGMPIGRRF